MLDYFSDHNISIYPSQMDIAFTERCNQGCDYCWVNKSNPYALNFNSAKAGIEFFLKMPVKRQTITFTTSEPLMIPELYQKTVEYILKNADSRKTLEMITTTNGINLNNQISRFIIKKIYSHKHFRLNISIDGRQQSHDAHRKLSAGCKKSAFDLSWDNFLSLPKNKVRVIFTVTPSEVDYFEQNINFLIASGFKVFDIFPQVFVLWPQEKIRKIEKILAYLVEYANTHSKESYDWRILNRLWGSSHYNKLLLSSDGNFYLFEWVMALPYRERKSFIIGNTAKGIDLEKRIRLFDVLFKNVAKSAKQRCLRCSYRVLCSCPLPLFLWCNYSGLDFDLYFSNFCKISRIFITASQKLNKDIRCDLDSRKIERLK